ncbi:MAG: hypothetical protein KME25_08320 [Symplocastrum torsivum CPER-KK1]|jgi:hypothetical protein|uniref:Uncharacterized protein n=1 Tax=Symplocastrum torsivum CPER-KK1 TaxID=450513 RepID=A0A951PJ42_9CYAN|nr:hypothetical protein [Symplocastrum torsivum CPER-KK1]
MDKMLTDRQNIINSSRKDEMEKLLVKVYIYQVFKSLPRRLFNWEVVFVYPKNDLYTTEKDCNSPQEQNMSSDSLTMRAIQAFMDTEDEWAGVYANLAES